MEEVSSLRLARPGRTIIPVPLIPNSSSPVRDVEPLIDSVISTHVSTLEPLRQWDGDEVAFRHSESSVRRRKKNGHLRSATADLSRRPTFLRKTFDVSLLRLPSVPSVQSDFPVRLSAPSKEPFLVEEFSEESGFSPHDAFLLNAFARMEMEYVQNLRALVACYESELFVQGSLVSIRGAQVVTLNARDLLDFHLSLIKRLRNLQVEGDDMNALAGQLIGGLELYRYYAAHWKASEAAFAQLLNIPEFVEVSARQNLPSLRAAPLLQVSKYLGWSMAAKLDENLVAELRACRSWIQIAHGDGGVAFSSAHAVSSCLSLLLDKERFNRAAFHLMNAVNGFADPVVLDDDGTALRIYAWIQIFSLVRSLCIIGLFLVSIFEMPSWCYGADLSHCASPPLGAPPGSVLYNSNLVYLSIVQGLSIELSLLVCFLVSGPMLEFFSMRTVSWDVVVTLVALGVAISDVILTFALYSFEVYPVFRLSVWMRPVLMLISSRIGKVSLFRLVQAIFTSLPVLIALALYLLISTSIATVLWFPSVEYQNFGLALSALQICMTTANFPDVMLPQYLNSRAAFIFFFLFITIGIFFLLSLILGEIRNSYNNAVDTHAGRFAKVRLRELVLAYNALSVGRKWVPVSELKELLGTMVKMYPLAGTGEVSSELQEQRVKLILITAEANFCTQEAFLKGAIAGVTASIDSSNILFRRFIVSRVYVFGVCLFICVCLALAGVGVWATVASNASVLQGIFWATQVLLVISLVEVIAKICFYQSLVRSLRFQGLEIYLLVIGIVVDACAIGLRRDQLVVIWLATNPFRILLFYGGLFKRLLNSLRAIRFLFFAMLPSLISAYLVFAWVGIYLFGGELYQGNPKLQGSTYAAANYYVFNWNDMPSSLVSQFVLLVQNNAFVLSDGAIAVSGWSVKPYFVTFWVCFVLILLNIFFSLVFRLVDLAKEANDDDSEVGDDVVSTSPMISLKDGVYEVEGDFDVEMERYFTRATPSRVVLTRGASAIFSSDLVETALPSITDTVESIMSATPEPEKGDMEETSEV